MLLECLLFSVGLLAYTGDSTSTDTTLTGVRLDTDAQVTSQH